VADGRTILLLGAGGFAGGHFREAAAATEHPLVGTSRTGHGADLACDLLDPGSIRRALADVSPDAIVNLAGSASVADSWSHPGQTFAVNAQGVLNLLEAAAAEAPGAYLLCVSSAEVYGDAPPEALPLREDDDVAPVTPYGASKAAMEVICGQYARARSLRIGIVRSFNQIGPRQPAQFAVSGFARQIAETEVAGAGQVELAVGNPAASRDFIDVRDGARALLAVAERELDGTFNLCRGEAVSLRTVIDAMAAATKLEVDVRPAPELARPADPQVHFGDAGRLREATGWSPEIPLERSLADVLDWWRLAGAGDAAA
jgi:GDP-4-dehydro-6-deoxy-D-mannose reductase